MADWTLAQTWQFDPEVKERKAVVALTSLELQVIIDALYTFEHVDSLADWLRLVRLNEFCEAAEAEREKEQI
jgi:hypothetical protein